MFALADYLFHVEGEPLPRDTDAQTAAALLSQSVTCAVPVTGTVYGTLLNDRAALSALGDAVHEAPYKAPPKAPILYVKPRNTLTGHGTYVTVPENVAGASGPGIEVGASLGIVIGRTATRVAATDAFDYIAGYTIIADLSIPHASVYRPSVRFRARDRFCAIGPAIVARRHVADPDNLSIAVHIEGRASFVASTATSVRSVAHLLADVTDFMTLSAGDVLTLGVPYGSPVAHADDIATMTIADWPSLRLSFVSPDAIHGEQS